MIVPKTAWGWKTLLFVGVVIACSDGSSNKGAKEKRPESEAQPQPEPLPNPEPQPDTTLSLTAETSSIQEWVNTHCVMCHSTATAQNRHVDLTDLSEAIKTSPNDPETGEGRKLIEPGQPDKSIFYQIVNPKLTPQDELMPMGGDPIDQQILEVIATWIDQMEPLGDICAEDAWAEGCACNLDPSSESCRTFCDEHPLECLDADIN